MGDKVLLVEDDAEIAALRGYRPTGWSATGPFRFNPRNLSGPVAELYVVLQGPALSENRTRFLPKPYLPNDVRDAIRHALLENLHAIPRETHAATTH